MKIKTKLFALYTDREEDGMHLRVYADSHTRELVLKAIMLEEITDENDKLIEDSEQARELFDMLNDPRMHATSDCWDFFTQRIQKAMDSYHLEDIEMEVDGEPVTKQRVFIEVEGGVVSDVVADDDTMLCYLIDHDNGKTDDETREWNKQRQKESEGLGSLTIL